MMKEPNIPEGATTVTLDVGMEVYLRERQDAVHYIGTFFFNLDHLDDDDLLESFMGIVTKTIRSIMDDRTEPMFVFSDRKSNKVMVETDEIQAISISAPSEETISQAIAEGGRHE